MGVLSPLIRTFSLKQAHKARRCDSYLQSETINDVIIVSYFLLHPELRRVISTAELYELIYVGEFLLVIMITIANDSLNKIPLTKQSREPYLSGQGYCNFCQT